MSDRRVNVKLTADASDYIATMAKAAAATEALDKKVDEAEQRRNNALRSEKAAAEQVRVAEAKLGDLRDRELQQAKDIEQAQKRVGRARSEATILKRTEDLNKLEADHLDTLESQEKATRDLGRARATLADKTYDVENAERKLREAQATRASFDPDTFIADEQKKAKAEADAAARRVEREEAAARRRAEKAAADGEKEAKAAADGFDKGNKKSKPLFEEAGVRSAGSFSSSFKREFEQRKVFFGAVVGGALTAGAPLALAGAALLFGGIAAYAGARTQEVRDAWTKMGRDMAAASLEDSRIIVPAFQQMAGDVGKAVEDLRPQIRQAFEAAAPLVETFTDALTGFAKDAMPGFVSVLQQGAPVMEGFQSFMESLGTGFTGLLDNMAKHSSAAGQAFRDWGDIIGRDLLPLIGELLGQGAELANMVLPPIANALGLVLDITQLLGPLLPTLAAGFLSMKLAGAVSSGLDRFAASAAASTGVLNGTAGAAERVASNFGRVAGALPALGAVITGIAGTHSDATQKENEWARAIAEGGDAAVKAYKEYKDHTHFGQAIDEATGMSASWDDAKEAAKALADNTPGAAAGLDAVTAASSNASRQLVDLPGVISSAAGSIALVGTTAGMTQTQMESATQKVVDFRNTLQTVATAFVDPLTTYQSLLQAKEDSERKAAQATANTTEDSKDSWFDYAATTKVTLQEVSDQLQTQIKNQENWRTNIGLIAQWAGVDVANYLAKMGKDGVDIVAQMADGTSGEAQRMAGLIKQDIDLGSQEWAASMQLGTAIMAEKGKQGGAATAQSIADALHVGLADVQREAAKYGIALADGINPLMSAMGKPRITTTGWDAAGFMGPVQLKKNAAGNLYENHQAEIAPGGAWRVWAEPETGGEAYIPLAPAKRARSMAIWRETGKRLDAPEAQYYAFGGINDVPRPPSFAPTQPPVSTAAQATAQKGYDEVIAWMKANPMAVAGPAGSGGGMTGTWTSIWGIVKAAIPQARQNSTYRPGDPGYHGKNKAIDFGFGSGPGGNGSAGLASIARFLYTGYGRKLAELIYDGVGDDTPDIKNGQDHVYNAQTRAEHHNHVHAAVYHDGTNYVPRTGFAYLEKGEAVIPADIATRFSDGGIISAAKEILARVTSGGQLYEDLTWRGASSNVGQYNDALTTAYYNAGARGFDYQNPQKLAGFLSNYIAQSSREYGYIGSGGGATVKTPSVTVNARVFIGEREITDIVRVEASSVVAGALGGIVNRGGYNG